MNISIFDNLKKKIQQYIFDSFYKILRNEWFIFFVIISFMAALLFFFNSIEDAQLNYDYNYHSDYLLF